MLLEASFSSMQSRVLSLSWEQRGKCEHCTLQLPKLCGFIQQIVQWPLQFPKVKIIIKSLFFQPLGWSSPCRTWQFFSTCESLACLSCPLLRFFPLAKGSLLQTRKVLWALSVLLLFHTQFQLARPCSVLLTDVLIPWKLCWRHRATLGDQLSSVSKPVCSNHVNGDRCTPTSGPSVHTSLTNHERGSCTRIYQINTYFIWLVIPGLTSLKLWFQH